MHHMSDCYGEKSISFLKDSLKFRAIDDPPPAKNRLIIQTSELRYMYISSKITENRTKLLKLRAIIKNENRTKLLKLRAIIKNEKKDDKIKKQKKHKQEKTKGIKNRAKNSKLLPLSLELFKIVSLTVKGTFLRHRFVLSALLHVEFSHGTTCTTQLFGILYSDKRDLSDKIRPPKIQRCRSTGGTVEQVERRGDRDLYKREKIHTRSETRNYLTTLLDPDLDTICYAIPC
uniref:Uncharacterized protein n=1 Tax=Romanomermis culicivorax TaxID=13658 RepID=A0A915HL48_ROMCU